MQAAASSCDVIMQHVARYQLNDYNNGGGNNSHQNTTTAPPSASTSVVATNNNQLYTDGNSPLSVESSPSDQPSVSSYPCIYQQQQNIQQGKSTVSTSMNLQQSPPGAAVDYSNNSSVVSSSVGSNGEASSVVTTSYMPVSYCLAAPSQSSSDVYDRNYPEESSLNLHMQQGDAVTSTTVTTPEVISMLKSPDFDSQGGGSSSGISSSSQLVMYGDDKVLDHSSLGIMRDLVKPSASMDGPHCSNGPAFPQHLSKDYFIPDDRVQGATVHHMGHTGLGDIHYPVMPLQHNQMMGTSGPIKAEPPHGSMMGGSPPVSPINMDQQELIKSERKRMRNRIAAHKCRRRKLERISKLEDKVASLKSHNADLTSNIAILKQQVAVLKTKVMDHMQQGCEIMIDQRQVLV